MQANKCKQKNMREHLALRLREKNINSAVEAISPSSLFSVYMFAFHNFATIFKNRT